MKRKIHNQQSNNFDNVKGNILYVECGNRMLTRVISKAKY